jgi:hypothetical protein
VARWSLILRAVSRVTSRGVPSGWSIITWNSLLLSKGSILTFTRPTPTSAAEARKSAITKAKNAQRAEARVTRAVMTRR